jgi:hypothetical protein
MKILMLEFGPPFQWRPVYSKFGDFRRVMWGWAAATVFHGGGIHELAIGLARAAVEAAKKGWKPE